MNEVKVIKTTEWKHISLITKKECGRGECYVMSGPNDNGEKVIVLMCPLCKRSLVCG